MWGSKRSADDGGGGSRKRQASSSSSFDGGAPPSLSSEYERHFATLNENFVGWMRSQVDSGQDSASWSAAVRDYIAYANKLQERYQEDYGDVYAWGTGDCGQIGNGVEDGASLVFWDEMCDVVEWWGGVEKV